MPDIMKDFAHLDAWSDDQLLSRQAVLKGAASPADLPEEVLQELLAIMRRLRGRSIAPKAKSTKAPAPSLDAL